MAKNIFIAATEPRSGKSLVALGLINAIQGIVPSVGYMKPIGQRYRYRSEVDEDAVLIKGVFWLEDDIGDINPARMSDVQTDRESLFDTIFDAYARISADKDVVVIEGTDYTSTVTALEFDINAELAKNLVAPVVLVARGSGRSIDEIARTIEECAESFREMGCNLLGTLVNRFESKDYEADRAKLAGLLEGRGIPLFGAIPPDPTLSGPRFREVVDQLKARIVHRGDDLSRVVTGMKVIAMNPENALDFIRDRDGYLIITSGDRVEHILTILCAHNSRFYPTYSGILLTGGLVPREKVFELISGLPISGLSIVSLKDDTYSAALKVNGVSGELSKEDPEKINLANQIIERHVDFGRIYTLLGTVDTNVTTPKMFQYRLVQIARSKKKHIVLPEGAEPRILRAAEQVVRKGICDVTLLGNRDNIQAESQSMGLDLSGVGITDPETVEPGVIEGYGETLYGLRKHKSVTKEMALDLMVDPVYFATMMVYSGDADGFVSGAVHSTADTLGPVLRVIKTREGVSIASSVLFMLMPNQILVYGDCALIENPDAQQLAEIALTSAVTAKTFGIEPVVAMLSYSTGESGKGRDVDKVREATEIVREKRPDLPVEGPIQYDAAVSLEVARAKISDSQIAGRATVLVFPDLDAGNTAYKAVQRSANVSVIGPILQGLAKPANDLSRGALVVDIVYTIAVTAIQAQQRRP